MIYIMHTINNRFWSTWTSLFLLIPALFSFLQGKLSLSILVVLLAIFSTLYHLTKPSGVDWWWHKKKPSQHLLQIVDTVLGIIIGAVIFKEIYSFGINTNSIFVLFFALISFFFLFISTEYYEGYHGIWHIMASVTILLYLLLI